MSYIKIEDDEQWFFDVGGCWIQECNVCQHCRDQRESKNQPYIWADEQYSFGVYAGRYCEACWKLSGYRDANDPTAEFDPADAGEVMEESDY